MIVIHAKRHNGMSQASRSKDFISQCLALFYFLKNYIVGNERLRQELHSEIAVLKHQVVLLSLLLQEEESSELEFSNQLIGKTEEALGISSSPYSPPLDILLSIIRSDRDSSTIQSNTKSAEETLTLDGVATNPIYPWAKKAIDLLNTADEAALQEPIYAFRAYFEARRTLLYGLDQLHSHSLIEIRAKTICSEAREMPDSPKKEALLEILCDDKGYSKENTTLVEIIEATEILHEYYVDSFKRMEDIRLSILNFMINTVVAIILVILLLPDLSSAIDIRSRTFLYLVVIFGILGASVSGIRSAGHKDPSQQLDQILGYWLALARTLIGAASASLLYLFLLSGVVGTDFLTAPLILGVAFAAGFSERLLLRTVKSLEGVGGVRQ